MKTPRLNETQVADYRREGYLLYHQPVLPPQKFAGLKACFENLLAKLPGEVRPETMDVPHFVHPELFEWLFAEEVLDLVAQSLGAHHFGAPQVRLQHLLAPQQLLGLGDLDGNVV